MAAIVLVAAALCPIAPTIAAPLDAPVPLRAGDYQWFDPPQRVRLSVTQGAPVAIVVSIADQRAYVYQSGRLIGVSTVSTGSRGRETPVGEFTILQKKPFHRSNLYSNAPMPFMQRLTWGGIALHAGHLPGYPASHGCIRLPAAFAEQLYALTELGGAVAVVRGPVKAPVPEAPAAPLLVADTRDLGGAMHVTPRKQPPVASAPLLVAEPRNLGGAAYDVLTLGGEGPPPTTPASFTLGPAREIVQPIDGRTN
ncbi:L,D-transpeptidase family protein [Sphingomonas sp. CJ20]